MTRLTGITLVAIGSLLSLQSPAIAQSPEENIAVVQGFFEAYADGDLEAMGSLMAEDVVWRIPGRHPLSGEKQGRGEVIAFFDQLGKANFKADPIYFGANETFVVDIHRGWSNVKGGPNVDTTWALIYRIEDGRIAEATNLSADQDTANAFFWATYRLKPIPDRLAD